MKPKMFFMLLLAVIVMAQSTMIAMVYWTSTVSNDLAKEKSLHLIEQATQSAQSNLSILTFDYGLWDQAFEWIVNRDDENIFEGFGTSATDGPNFHEIYLLNSTGNPLYAFARDGTESDLEVVDQVLSDRLYSMVQNLPIEPYDVVSGFSVANENVAIVAAGRVQPRDSSSLAPADLPVMVAVHYLDDDLLSGIASSLLLEEGIELLIPELSGELSSETSSAKSTGANTQLPIIGLDKSTIALLTWQAPKPGNEVFRRSIPVALLITLVLLGVTIAATCVLQKRAQELAAAEKRAELDPLTGLLNRLGLECLMTSPRGQAALERGELALIYIDLNGFKALNDAAGHEAGDTALRYVAENLKSSVRAFDAVVRLGGDEFLCVLFGRMEYTTIQSISTRCVASLKHTVIAAESTTHVIDAAAGIAIASHGQQFEKLLREADSAMFTAKHDGSVEPVFYDNLARIA